MTRGDGGDRPGGAAEPAAEAGGGGGDGEAGPRGEEGRAGEAGEAGGAGEDAAPSRWAVDLHTHTNRSRDCLTRPAALVRRARGRGLHRVAVTDHDRIEGAFAAREEDRELVIVGEEVRTADGPELIGLFLRRFVEPGMSFRETAAAIRDQGAVTYLPHPFDRSRGGGAEFLDAHADCVDLVEGLNARTHDPERNRRAREWAGRHGLPVGAGSDAHLLREVGRGRLCCRPFGGAEDFLDAAAGGELTGRASGRWVHLGSTFARLAGALTP